VKENYFKNASTGVVQLVIYSLLMLTAIPLFIQQRGVEQYGVFALLSIVGTVYTFTGLGVNPALVRFLARQGRSSESHYDIATGLLLLLCMAFAVFSLGIMSRDLIIRVVLKVPTSLIADAEGLYFYFLVSNSLLLIGQVGTAIIDSQEKVYLSNLLQVVYNILYWGLVLVALVIGESLTAVGIAVCVATVVWFALLVGVARRAWGPLMLGGYRSAMRAGFKKQLSYGLQIYAGNLVGFLYEPITKILVSHFIGIREVGFLDIGLRFRNLAWTVVYRLQYPMYPVMAKLSDKDRVGLLVRDLEQKTFLLVVPVVGIIVCISQPLVSVWIGRDVEIIATTIAVLVSAHLLWSSTVTPYYHYLLAKGQASKTIVLQAVNVTVNVVLFLLFYQSVGYVAVLWANALAILTSFMIALAYQHRAFGIWVFASTRQFLTLLFVFAIITTAGIVLNTLVRSDILRVVSIAAAGILATVLLYRQFGMLTEEDVTRYLGDGNGISYIGKKLLCRR
jgi:O-antigen/teichoic acid export membrane protein